MKTQVATKQPSMVSLGEQVLAPIEQDFEAWVTMEYPLAAPEIIRRARIVHRSALVSGYAHALFVVQQYLATLSDHRMDDFSQGKRRATHLLQGALQAIARTVHRRRLSLEE
jgi:hypothetical protein